MPTTLRDVARASGVHPATVSRALNPQTEHLVNATTAARVREAAEQLGYVPNPVARSLKTARSSTVGVIIPDLTNPLFPPIVRGIEDVLSQVGYTALVANTDDDPEREARQAASLRARQVEGFIMATARQDHALLERLVADGVPVVLVNRQAHGVPVNAVAGDDAAGVGLAVEHLATLGHTRIAHLAGPHTTSTGVERAHAFRDAMRTCGLVVDEDLVVECATFREPAGAQALGGLLDSGQQFTAVLAANDLVALGCYDALAARGLRCPDDVSVVGFNDMPFSDKFDPPLTTVHVPTYEVGAQGARTLLGLLERNRTAGAPTTSRLPLSLTVRGSTAPPRG